MVQVLLVVVLFAIGVLCVWALVIVVNGLLSERPSWRFSGAYSTYAKRVSDYSQRLNLLRPHATDYMNSLSPDARIALNELQKVLSYHHHYVEQIGYCMEAEAFPDAERLLHEAVHGVRLHTGMPGPSVENWERQLEVLLQTVGQDVKRASDKARGLRVPRGRARRSTAEGLSVAGIAVGEEQTKK